MPKLKTKTCVAKRFKVTATGKVMMKKAGARHLLSHKSSKRMMGLRKKAVLFKTDAERVKKLFA
jgi:large subunit ribosomal protein L35